MFNLSKIQIESNSQHFDVTSCIKLYCVQSFKDTNRKQFTTSTPNTWAFSWLCSIFQRYKSKAIHNNSSSLYLIKFTVFNLSKIQIESNSQLLSYIPGPGAYCVQSFKDTNRKQFTTRVEDSLFLLKTVFNLSKIQIESNSQRHCAGTVSLRYCVQSFKDTNRKQFTTRHPGHPCRCWLCSIFQRYKSKAIHNNESSHHGNEITVFNLSKIQIESNSQLIGRR